MSKCPWSGKHCLKPKLWHVTDVIGGEVKPLSFCEDCIDSYLKNETPPKIDPKSQLPSPEFLESMLKMVEDIIDEAHAKDIVYEQDKTKDPNLAPLISPVTDIKVNEKPPCPHCGMTLKEIKSKSLLGCNSCYDYFREELKSAIWKSHSTPTSPEILEHKGKIPNKVKSKPKKKRELSPKQQLVKLEYKLAKAVDIEDYESAAALRDIIKELKEKM